jgi:hypothetical protein
MNALHRCSEKSTTSIARPTTHYGILAVQAIGILPVLIPGQRNTAAPDDNRSSSVSDAIAVTI